jgi:hypothetical protein
VSRARELLAVLSGSEAYQKAQKGEGSWDDVILPLLEHIQLLEELATLHPLDARAQIVQRDVSCH